MRWFVALILMLGLAGSAPIDAQELADSTLQAGRSGLSIAESGVDASNNRLFRIVADRVDVADVLRAFFKQAGVEFAIDPDVSGPINLSRRDVTFLQGLQALVQVAKPQIKVTRGANNNVYHVSRDPDAQRAADAIANRIQQMGAHAYPSVVPGNIIGQTNPLNSLPTIQIGAPGDRTVTLEVSEEHPIPLADALSRISQQAHFPIYVDRRVPRELSFAGTITEAPLSLVLQRIATTTGLKLLASPTQATFVPPDQFTIRVNNMLVNQYPNMPCAKCGQQISSLWSYCPYCGQITPRGAQLLNPRNGASGGAQHK